MKAIVLQELKRDTEGMTLFDSLVTTDVPYPEPGENEVTVKVMASALNHRDLWIVRGLYAGIKPPIILGSDGAGIVDKVGGSVDAGLIGSAVIINPSLRFGDNPRVQGKEFSILGLPEDGTQAEYVRVPAENIFAKPDFLSFEQAAALPLAGITGYRALFTQGKLESGQVVVISGIGGGVSSLMLAMAVGRGAKVYVTSSSDEKIGAAVADGAIAGVNYHSEDWVKQLQALTESGGIDLVVDSAGGDGFASLLDCLKPGGRLTFFGATRGFPSGIDLRKMFFKQITIQGTTMGNNADFANMVDLVNTLQMQPRIDGPTSIKDIRQAYNKMHAGDQFGKLVLSHDSWN